MVNIIIIVIII